MNPKKMGLDTHHLDVCCKRQLDHEAGQLLVGDILERMSIGEVTTDVITV